MHCACPIDRFSSIKCGENLSKLHRFQSLYTELFYALGICLHIIRALIFSLCHRENTFKRDITKVSDSFWSKINKTFTLSVRERTFKTSLCKNTYQFKKKYIIKGYEFTVLIIFVSNKGKDKFNCETFSRFQSLTHWFFTNSTHLYRSAAARTGSESLAN